MNTETVFVQIASYRDPELLPTLRDLFAKADEPDNLTVCIAWQHSPEDAWDTLSEFVDDSRIIVLDIPHTESKGACWARNQIQKHYSGQAYTLQLDSHHRFVQGWDTLLLEMYGGLLHRGFKKPLITAYIPSYDPKRDPEGRVNEPWKTHFDRFSPEGIVFPRPGTIDDWYDRSEPVPARFYSAHFAFADGKFCKEVPHDPNFYFHGEEISITVRAFTHGYDLFHPHRVVAWHEYTREDKARHWDDNSWDEQNKIAHSRLRQLLGVDGEKPAKSFGRYGLGKKRTVQDWERYAGIRFSDRTVQQETLDFKIPPNYYLDAPFLSVVRHYLDIYKGDLPEKDYEFFAIAFEKEDNTPIIRLDATKEEIELLFTKKGDFLTIYREYTGESPHHWVVWPYSTSKGWCERIVRDFK